VPDEHVRDSYQYIGNRPAATGSGGGWHMRGELVARCIRCGDFVSLDPEHYGHCRCGALHKDPDAARFGSSFGDDQIGIYSRRL
jgi:hypothetical protein